ncbi:MAG TPA: tRNA uridine-5-carboxymethylaminomethyl(34) synthesis GTPase MnmE [Syntrophorhabdales bacterium]|nr:tRNA uridine-5-carboxymethylaminomethyl(34) synthesis GTPase MnmE [Syntrophorhabdales bacterium]
MYDPDTICVVSSALGEAGIGVLRMSGPQAHSVLRTIFQPKKPVDSFSPRHLYLGFIINPDTGEPVDEVFAVFMNGPWTYTREPMAEVYSHGGINAPRKILSLMVRHGARVAEPGEFTKRAFLNGRIDLAQAESVLDVIRSESDQEAGSALRHLAGLLSERIGSVRDQVRIALANTEAMIDFPDEELEADGLINRKETVSLLDTARQKLQELICSYADGRAVKNGVEVLIVGRTNVGKSSLLNALLMEEKAIVTALPGTTRDLIEDVFHVKGIKLRIIDTAGLRMPRDAAEEQGIERVKKRIPAADVVLWVLDNAENFLDEDEHIYDLIKDKKIVSVLNKSDLPQKLDRERLIERNLTPVNVCALNGSGLDMLKEVLYDVAMGTGHKSPALLITNVRHRDALIRVDEALQRALSCTRQEESPEFTAFELREALSCFGEITGETCNEEILDEIFSKFCIGK